MSCGNIKHGEGCTCISCYTYRKAMPVPTAPPIAPAPQWTEEQVRAIRAFVKWMDLGHHVIPFGSDVVTEFLDEPPR